MPDDLEEYVYRWASQHWPWPAGRDWARWKLAEREIKEAVWKEAREYYLKLTSGREN